MDFGSEARPQVAREIRRIRGRLGLSQEGFAAALGMPGSQAQVSKWERGAVAPAEGTLRQIAKLAHVSPELFGLAPEGETGESEEAIRFRETLERVQALVERALYGTAEDEAEPIADELRDRLVWSLENVREMIGKDPARARAVLSWLIDDLRMSATPEAESDADRLARLARTVQRVQQLRDNGSGRQGSAGAPDSGAAAL